ncbi:MAG: imidazolonepropionase [Candidatus Kapabacteria bacterium]|nr:imidazolonepropionase [Candidatus Kapabacteria bacterium]
MNLPNVIGIKNIGSLLTISANDNCVKTLQDMNNLSIINDAIMLFDVSIQWIGTSAEFENVSSQFSVTEWIDAKGKVVMPGFVDSHTHTVFAGNRSNEFAQRLQGVSYQQIAASGGGILTTVNGVRTASQEQIVTNAYSLLQSAISFGTTTMEIKSGYGLSFDAEMKLLYSIREVASISPMNIVSTFMGAHDFPEEYKHNHSGYVSLVCEEMIPAVSEQHLATFCDVFTDKGYYTLEETETILSKGLEYGLLPKMHADELATVHATELACEIGAFSADHLLHVSQKGVEALSQSKRTVATLLPGTAYTLRLPYAPARTLIDNGAMVALATDCNPGSCFTENMQTILSFACMNMKMSIEESIVASTLHGAKALGLERSKGSLEIGKDADFLVLQTTNYADIVYHFGTNLVEQTWIGGKKHFQKQLQ